MLHIVIGGAASGKSGYAEQLVTRTSYPHRIYLATMQPFDEESVRRIEKHRAMRKDKGFQTIEWDGAFTEQALPQGSIVLLDCLSNLLANVLYQSSPPPDPTAFILAGIDKLLAQVKELVLVTNNVFEDGQTYDRATQGYIRLLGELHTELCKRAVTVTEVVCGLPLHHKQERM